MCGEERIYHLVVSKTMPREVTSGVALLERGAADVIENGEPSEPCGVTNVISSMQSVGWKYK